MTMPPDNGSSAGLLRRAEFEPASALGGRIVRWHRVAEPRGGGPAMHLVVHIPYQADEESSRAVSLDRQASSFSMEWM